MTTIQGNENPQLNEVKLKSCSLNSHLLKPGMRHVALKSSRISKPYSCLRNRENCIAAAFACSSSPSTLGNNKYVGLGRLGNKNITYAKCMPLRCENSAIDKEMKLYFFIRRPQAAFDWQSSSKIFPSGFYFIFIHGAFFKQLAHK